MIIIPHRHYGSRDSIGGKVILAREPSRRTVENVNGAGMRMAAVALIRHPNSNVKETVVVEVAAGDGIAILVVGLTPSRGVRLPEVLTGGGDEPAAADTVDHVYHPRVRRAAGILIWHADQQRGRGGRSAPTHHALRRR